MEPRFCPWIKINRPCPFVANDIKQLMKTRDKLHRRFLQTRDTNDWVKFKKSHRSVKRALKDAERNHTLQKVQRNKNNPSSLWKVINLATPFWECERQIYTKDHKIVADEFNRFFSTVGRNAAKATAKLVTASHINCSGLLSLSPLASQVMIFLILNLCPVKTFGGLFYRYL